MSIARDVFTTAHGHGRRLLLPRRHGRAAALPRYADAPARSDESRQSRASAWWCSVCCRGPMGRSVPSSSICIWLLVQFAGATVAQLIARVARRGRIARMTAISDRRYRFGDAGAGGRRLDNRRARDIRRGVGFVAYGLLLALVWVRLRAVDVALTEAAIGSGVTGVFCFAPPRERRQLEPTAAPPGKLLRLAAAVLCATVSAGLAASFFMPPDPAPTLAPAAAASLPATGLGNPVTAVLLAFRAFDTFLEKVVLLLALVGVWSLAADRDWGGAPRAVASGP